MLRLPEKWSSTIIAGIVLTVVGLGAVVVLLAPDSPQTEPVNAQAPDYHIVYLLNRGAVSSRSPIAPARLNERLGARAVHSWQRVLALDAAVPIDALIVHDSALDKVDPVWLKVAYRCGVVIATFNVYAPQLADLMDLPDIASTSFASEPYPGTFYVIVSQYYHDVRLDHSNMEAPAAVCALLPPVEQGRRHGGTAGRATNEIVDLNSVDNFSRVLVLKIQGIKAQERVID